LNPAKEISFIKMFIFNMLMIKDAISGINTNTASTSMEGRIKRYALFW